jgi:hypothetical protein
MTIEAEPSTRAVIKADGSDRTIEIVARRWSSG